MEFIKFPHIRNVEHALVTVKQHLQIQPEGAEWVATEKLDGSNFQFSITAEGIVCYSRNFELGEERVFHNFQRLEEKYGENLKEVFELLCRRRSTKELVVRVYGEIFGGQYPGVILNDYVSSPRKHQPHKAGGGEGAEGGASCSGSGSKSMYIAPVNDKPVQDRVFYIPDIDFYLFDITHARTDVAPDHEDSVPIHLDIEDLIEVGSTCRFTYVANILHRGTFAQMQELCPDFPTTIPAIMGLPPIEDNMAEGYVLLPLHQLRSKKALRVKLKSEKFCEVEKVQHGDRPQIPKTEKSKEVKPLQVRMPVANLNPKEQEFEVHLLSCVNANRLYSVKSKLEEGEIQRMDPRRLTALLLDDALEELIEDREDLIDLLADLDKAAIKKVKGNVFYAAFLVVEAARAANH